MVNDLVDIKVMIRARNPNDTDERGLHEIEVHGTAITLTEALEVFESALRAASWGIEHGELYEAYEDHRARRFGPEPQ